jgi:hypothetical protein
MWCAVVSINEGKQVVKAVDKVLFYSWKGQNIVARTWPTAEFRQMHSICHDDGACAEKWFVHLFYHRKQGGPEIEDLIEEIQTCYNRWSEGQLTQSAESGKRARIEKQSPAISDMSATFLADSSMGVSPRQGQAQAPPVVEPPIKKSHQAPVVDPACLAFLDGS